MKGRQSPGIELRTPSLCSQCSATELQQLDNHQPPQSSISPNRVLTAHTEWLPGVQLKHFSLTCPLRIEDCEGWWLSGCRSSVAEHWLHKPGVLGSIPGDYWPFHFPQFSPHNIKIFSLFQREARVLRIYTCSYTMAAITDLQVTCTMSHTLCYSIIYTCLACPVKQKLRESRSMHMASAHYLCCG